MDDPASPRASPPAPDNGIPTPRAGPLAVARAVLWSFLGIRRGRDLERDMASITPLQVVIGGLLGAVLLVGALLLLVRWIIASAG